MPSSGRSTRRSTRQRPPQQAKMDELDLKGSGSGVNVTPTTNDIPDDAWWVFVMPTSEGAPAPIPGGRYGWWAKKPAVAEDTYGWTIRSSDAEHLGDEPSVFIDRVAAISVYVAQMRHTRNPELPPQSGAMTPV
jgi:hypothetical protein